MNGKADGYDYSRFRCQGLGLGKVQCCKFKEWRKWNLLFSWTTIPGYSDFGIHGSNTGLLLRNLNKVTIMGIYSKQ